MPALQNSPSCEERNLPPRTPALAVSKCTKTFGGKDRRLAAPERQAAALAQFLEGVGQRATERLLGVSHNAITDGVKQAVWGKVLQATPAEKIEWVEADELWTMLRKKEACWLWWAMDRASKRVLDWVLGDRGTETIG